MHAANQLRAALPRTQGKSFGAALEAPLPTALGQAGEAGRVGAWRLRPVDHALVAGHLALAAKAALDPCERGIQWEENQGKLLQEIDPVVAAAQVFGLMQNHLFEFGRREAGEEPVRNKNTRREEADDAGTIEMARGADFDGPAQEMRL